MEELEYLIVDELYFVVTFDELLRKTGLPQDMLGTELINLVKKGWVKLVDIKTDSEIEDHSLLERDFKKYNYLFFK